MLTGVYRNPLKKLRLFLLAPSRAAAAVPVLAASSTGRASISVV